MPQSTRLVSRKKDCGQRLQEAEEQQEAVPSIGQQHAVNPNALPRGRRPGFQRLRQGFRAGCVWMN